MAKLPLTPIAIQEAKTTVMTLTYLEHEIYQLMPHIDPVTKVGIRKIFDDYCDIITQAALRTVESQRENEKS